MFEIKNVSKKYNSEYALRDVNLTIGKGMNFIIGSSGSGKTTLLKIISGMENDFDGEVFYSSKNIKTLSVDEKSYFYNRIFGFVWQDFHLLDESTVMENIMLPSYISDNNSEKTAQKILCDLKILDLENQKVKNLSGGQKQRVAIARELMKNPQVIIADEPTSALDGKASDNIISILRSLSKSRTVIVVTHDESLVTDKDNVIQLDKGELVSSPKENSEKSLAIKSDRHHKLSFGNSFKLSTNAVKRKPAHFIVSILSLVIASILLLTSVGGSVAGSSNQEFEDLLATYGENILDLTVAGSFTSAGGADGAGSNKPNADVTQDISGLYDKYANDERVEFAAFMQAFDDITVNMDGADYQIQQTGSAPVIRKLFSGRFANGNTNEVVVPESFVKQSGKTNDTILGTEIEFSCTMVNWDSGEPVFLPAKTKAVIVGVADNTVIAAYEGQTMEYSVDDAFIFSKSALDDLRGQAKIKNDSINFTIRAKTPQDLISIKDELNANGIVPIGQFELVEDMVDLQGQTAEQSTSASVVIGILSFVIVAAIFLITGFLRKKEYAVYKISGYKTSQLALLRVTDALFCGITSVLLFFVTSPLINLATKALFKLSILNAKMLFTGAGFVLAFAIFALLLSMIPCIKIDLSKELKAGDR